MAGEIAAALRVQPVVALRRLARGGDTEVRDDELELLEGVQVGRGAAGREDAAVQNHRERELAVADGVRVLQVDHVHLLLRGPAPRQQLDAARDLARGLRRLLRLHLAGVGYIIGCIMGYIIGCIMGCIMGWISQTTTLASSPSSLNVFFCDQWGQKG